MRSLLELPVIRNLHQRQLLFPVVVLCVVVGVLADGALDRISRAEQGRLNDGANLSPDIAPPEMSRLPHLHAPAYTARDYFSLRR